MTKAAGALPNTVARALRRYAQHAALVVVLTAIGIGVAASAIIFITGAVIDRWFDVAPAIRAVFPALALIAWVYAGSKAAGAVLAVRGREHAATSLDKLVPGSRDVLRSSLDFLARGGDDTAPIHPFMLENTVSDASALADRVSPRALMGWRRVPHAWLGALLMIALVACLWLWPAMRMDLLLKRFIDPFGNHPRPSLTLIAVDAPLTIRVSEGDDFTVLAKLSGRIEAEPRAELNLTDARGVAQTLPMTPRPGNRFELTLRGFAESQSFCVLAGDGRTATHRIEVAPRPHIAKLIAQYTYPGYTRLPKRDEEVRFGEIRGVEGTRVRVDFETSMPIADASVAFPESKLGVRWDRSATKGTFNFVIGREAPFSVKLRSQSGADNRDGAPYRVRVVPDNPPTISLLNVPESLTFYRDDVFRINFRGMDDFGISEVYLRARGGKGLNLSGSNVTEIAVPFSPPGAKEVNGELTLELRDVTDEAATGVELELVMVDTKGQEAAAPRLQLTVLSDTIDRLLAELIAHQDRYGVPLRGTAQTLQSAANRLGFLAEGMDDTKLDGKRLEMFDQIARELQNVGVPNPAPDLGAFRVFGYTEFPERAGRQTIALFSYGLVLRRGADYAPLLKQTREAANAKQAILAVKALLDKEYQPAASLLTAFNDLSLQTRLEWVQAAVDQAIEAEAAVAKADKAHDARALMRQNQDARLAEITKTLAEVQPRFESNNETELTNASKALAAALALPAEERDRNLPAALRELQSKLAASPAMSGKLGAALRAHEKAFPIATALASAQDPPSVERATSVLGSRLRLRRLYSGATPAELLPAARLYEAGRTGDAASIAAAAAWARASEPWQASHDGVSRIMSLRAALRDTQVAVGTSKLAVDSVRFDRAWQQAREWVVSLAKDVEAGVFESADPAVIEELKKIAARRSLFEPTVAAEALRREPALVKRLGETLDQCDASIAALWPRVEPGVRDAAAQWPALMKDASVNLAGEAKLFDEEVSQITAEAAAAGQRAEIKRGERTRGGMSRPERMNFAIANNDRIICHGVALAAGLDARELQWAFTADQPTGDALASDSIMHLWLAHLDEETFDKTVGVYIAQVYGHKPYPAFIEEIGRYYTELAARFRDASSWTSTMAAGKSSELITNEVYQRVPAQINKLPRQLEAKRSTTRQAEFVKVFDAAKDAAARRTALSAMIDEPSTSPIVWERICLNLSGIIQTLDAAAAPQAGKPWTGVSPEASRAAIASSQSLLTVIPARQPVPDEFRGLSDTLRSMEALLTKVTPEKAGALPEADRQAAREELARWTGEATGLLRDLDAKALIPSPVVRPPARITGRIRADLERIESRLIRNEMNWSMRAGLAIQRSASARVDAMLPTAEPTAARRWACWVEAIEGMTRRRSAAAAAQQSRALGLDAGGPDSQFIKMPRHLYDELQRGAARPYPEQFKDTALKYMDGIVKDSR